MLNSGLLNRWDIVAVRPTNERLFQQVVGFDIDMISLEMDRRCGVPVKRGQVHVMREKGMVFEISYAGMLRSNEARKWTVSNALMIWRATGGKDVIISSGSRKEMELRGPYDAMNLAIVLGLNMDQARKAVIDTAVHCVKRGETRKSTFKGIVKFIDDDQPMRAPQ